MAVFASSRQNQAHAQQSMQRTGSKLKKSAMLNKGKAKETHGAQIPRAPETDSNEWDEETGNTEWQWHYLNDLSSSKAAPLFSRDGSYFFSLAGSSVKILSVSSGQVVSELETSTTGSGGQQPVRFTSAVINPDNAFQLITSTLDGRIIIWDFLNAIILREIDVGKPIHYICAHRNVKDSVFVAASLNKKKSQETDAIILRVSLNHGPSEKSSAEVKAIGKTRRPSGLALSPSGEWLVSTGGHTVYVARTSALETGFIKYISTDRLTSLAMHPSDDYFATGDEKGNIRLWYCLNDGAVKSRGVEKKAQTTSLHWHAHAVASLSFTSNGAYLLSGGEEAVLVIWQLHTGRKEFVPRVGSPIASISVYQGPLSEEYLLGLQDGTSCFISPSSLRIVRSFSQLKTGLESFLDDHKSTYAPLAFHQLSQSLILPSSHQSSLQIYSPFSTTLIGELEVSPTNRVSRRDFKPVETAKVRHVAISSSGLWMATTDVREEEPGYHPEVFLKIWSWESKNNRWQLHSRIDQPHGSKYPVKIAFSPHNTENPLYLASCGEDGFVKVWKLKQKTKEDLWLPHATLTFPPSHIKDLTWSPDGTLFVVALINRIHLYDTTFAVVDSLSTFEHKNTNSLDFIGNRHLLVVGQRNLTVWDLVCRSVSWTFLAKADIGFVVPHSSRASFAVFLEPNAQGTAIETMAYTFDIGSSSPRTEHTLPFKLRAVTATGPHGKQYDLIGFTHDSRIVFIDHNPSKQQSTSKRTLQFQTAQSTLFEDMFGGAVLDMPEGLAPLLTTNATDATDSRVGEAFSQPTHLMAPVSTLFDPVIFSLLKSTARSTMAEPTSDDEDSEDEAMEDIVVTSSSTQTSLPLRDSTSLQPLVAYFRKSCHVVQLPSKRVEIGTPKKVRTNGTAKNVASGKAAS